MNTTEDMINMIDTFRSMDKDEKSEFLKHISKEENVLFDMKAIITKSYSEYRKQYYTHRYHNDENFKKKIKDKAKLHYLKNKQKKIDDKKIKIDKNIYTNDINGD